MDVFLIHTLGIEREKIHQGFKMDGVFFYVCVCVEIQMMEDGQTREWKDVFKDVIFSSVVVIQEIDRQTDRKTDRQIDG